MRKNIVIWIVALLGFTFWAGGSLIAQHIVKGNLVDEKGDGLPSATVMLMTAQDSVLKSFGLSKSDGSFELRSVAVGKYYLTVTFLGLESLNKNLEVVSSIKEVDLGKLTLVEKSTELDAVDITAEMIPVQIKGDTVEYNAKAFKTQPNATVEDLIKRLPGLEVDEDGNVKAQGEDVQKVLVDGKEFFGDDPKIATQNLPADAIDKVQVFEKMSDGSEFTGVDDGNGQKTINLTLKKDRKNGVFGNVTGGYGTDNRFAGKANLNRFTEKSQLSFLGMGNNINDQPFSIQDYMNFMGGASNLMRGMGGGSGSGGVLSASDLGITWHGGGSQPPGINTAAAGGLNYNVDIGKKSQLTTSYFYNFLQADLTEQKYFEQVSPIGQTTRFDTTDQLNQNHNHRLNLRFKHKIDSSSQLILTGTGRFTDLGGTNNILSSSFLEESFRNSSLTDKTTQGGAILGSSTLNYMKRFRKKGRSLALEGSFDYQNQDKDVDFNWFTSQFDTAGVLFDSISDQDQLAKQRVLTYGGKATWTEPIGRGKFLEFLYTHVEQDNVLTKDFYDIKANEVEEYNTLLSNRYDGKWRYDQGGMNFRFITPKTNFTAGLSAQRSDLNGTIGLADSTLQKNFFTLLPSLRWKYTIKKGSRLNFRYSTSLNAPSIEQLSPVVDNSNQFSTFVGNPDLQAEYEHSARLRYMIFDQFSFTTLFTMIRASYTTNKISQAIVIDTADGAVRQLNSYTNVTDDLNLMWFGHFSTPIRKLGVKFNANPRINFNKGITLINQVQNPTNRLTSEIDFSLENRKKEKVDLRLGAKYTHNITSYAIAAELNQTFLNHKYYADLTIYLPKGLTLNTEFDYYLYTGGSFADDLTVPLLKAYVSKTFLKAEKAEVRLSVFDILNQNTGISRSTSINYLEENRFNTLTRYFMLSFTYKFLSVGKGKS